MKSNPQNALPWVALALASNLVTLLAARPSEAYEQATHVAITREAFLRSRLNPGYPNIPGTPALLFKLGIATHHDSLGEQYIDMAPGTQLVRSAFPADNANFTNEKLKQANEKSSFAPPIGSIPGWLMSGAVREDDVPFDRGALENNPQDAPDPQLVRVLNHFFDPYSNRPLLFWAKAPDWAIGTPDTSLRNHFDLAAGREAMWRALTLKQQTAPGVLADLPFPSNFASLGSPGTLERDRERLRLAYWATTFHALGSVVHLLQDMAQPQHTRNEPHSGRLCDALHCPGGHASFYEKYVDARITGNRKATLRERYWSWNDPTDVELGVVPAPIDFSAYPDPLPEFDLHWDFFATDLQLDSTNGSGLANYSNAGFFTPTTNIGDGGGGYPSPSSNPATYIHDSVPASSLVDAGGDLVRSGGSLTLLKGPVRDNLNPSRSATGVALSSRGAFDQFLNARTGRAQYVLTHYNYRDQAALLIPRAVAYSAGLLNHFFRGELEISLPDEGVFAAVDHTQQACKDTCGFGRLKLKLKNTTPNTEAMSGGLFVAVVKFRRNNAYQPDLSGNPGGPAFTGDVARSLYEEILVSAPAALTALGANQQLPVTFDFPQRIPINATDIQLQVVYRGRLGQEADAVAVTTLDIAEPSFYAMSNSTDYVYDATTDTFHGVPYGSYLRPDPITGLALSFNGTTPVATIPLLDGGQTAQLAFLGARGNQPTLATWTHGPAAQGAWNLPAYEFGSAGTGGPYQANINAVPSRGLHHVIHQFHTYPPGYIPVAPPCSQEPELCRQNNLSPLVKVAWQVNF